MIVVGKATALALGCVLALGAAGCSDRDGGRDTGGGTTTPATTATDTGAGDTGWASLQVVIDDGRGHTFTSLVACPATDAVGNAQCDLLERRPELFTKRPAERRGCVERTDLFREATATVTGTLRGSDVHVVFTRADGCGLARWQAADPVVEEVPRPGV